MLRFPNLLQPCSAAWQRIRQAGRALLPSTPADLSARRVQWTGRFALLCITLGMIALIGRVLQLQLAPPPPLAELIDTQYTAHELPGRRGAIYDRRGRIIACSDTQKRLYVDPQSISDPNTFAERVAEAFDYSPYFIEKSMSARPGSRYIVIDADLSENRFDLLRRLRASAKQRKNFEGLGVETRLIRNYPMGPLAGQILGFAGFEGNGMEGLEKAFNNHLLGEAGRMVYLRDVHRSPLWIDGRQYTSPVDGDSVRISLDAAIQEIAESNLRSACQEYDAQSGQMVVMDPYTGEILAMANYPAFDPNLVGKTSPDLRRNRAITDFFEPGSIFKPFVWSAATQMALAKPTEIIDCTTSGLWVTHAGRRLHDAHPNGIQTWDGVLIKSSNIGMAKIGERMGQEKMFRTLAAFGFGKPTGIGLDGESGGMVNQLHRWTPYSISSVPMGQEVGVTVLQMARAYSVFANGGYLLRPTIRAIDNPRDPRQLPPSYILGRVLSPSVAQHTRSVLRRVVTEGTGKKAESQLYQVFGKTGTAQIAAPGRGGYIPGAYIGSFVGGAPLERPRLVVAISIHRPDPRKGHYGGIIAAPAAKNTLEQSLQYLGVPADKPLPQVDDKGKIIAVRHEVDARE